MADEKKQEVMTQEKAEVKESKNKVTDYSLGIFWNIRQFYYGNADGKGTG